MPIAIYVRVSTHKQALSALVFLYEKVLGFDLPTEEPRTGEPLANRVVVDLDPGEPAVHDHVMRVIADIVQRCVTNWASSPAWWKNYCSDDSDMTSRFTAARIATESTCGRRMVIGSSSPAMPQLSSSARRRAAAMDASRGSLVPPMKAAARGVQPAASAASAESAA